MNSLCPSSLVRVCLPTVVAGAVFVACAAQTPPAANTSVPENTATSVPVGEVTPGLGPAGGNSVAGSTNVTMPPPPLNGGGNVVVPNKSSRAMLTVVPSTNQDLCLSTSTATPSAGAGVVLRPCALLASQRWWSENGRLHTDGNLCLSNPAITQDSVSATAAGTTQGNYVLPVLAACDSNDVRQHVELNYGALVGQTGNTFWGLTVAGGVATTGTLAWVTYDQNDAIQHWTFGSDSHDANGATSLTGVPLATSATGLCLDANTRGSDGNPVLGVQTCDPNVSSQRWRMSPWGSLMVNGRCLDLNNNLLTLPVCGQPVATQRWWASYGYFRSTSTDCFTPPAAGAPGPVILAPCTTTRWTLGVQP